jgi:4-cresol dehydrogenase (hydroxylating)
VARPVRAAARGRLTPGSERIAAAPQDLESALARWSAALGREHVFGAGPELEARSRSTLPTSALPIALLRPGSRDDVIAAVGIAAEFQLPLYPISRGRNWGYGDACPPTEGQVLLDLSRMDRIIAVDERLAYAVIEPGVSQGQLSAWLEERRLALALDCTGAGPDASVVGNILERGFGHTPYGDRLRTVSGLEVVLADGRVLETGFGHYAGARTAQVFPYGVGPAIDGLFTQSGMGVVTRMGVWLMPKPEAYQLFICSLERDEDLAPAVETLRRLRLEGTLRSVSHVGNDLRLISGAGPLGPQQGALSRERRLQLRRATGLGAWTVAGGLYGDAGQVAAARRRVKRALAGPARKLLFFDERRLAQAERIAGALGRFGVARSLAPRIASLRSLFELNRGRPSNRFLAGAYWRRRGGLPAQGPTDPAAEGCGLMWLAPVIPATGEAALELVGLIEPIFNRHGFDAFLTLSTITDRCLGAVFTICYDREDAADAARALACYEEAFDAAVDAGFPPYRVGVQSMGRLARKSEVFWEVAADLKRALDPQGLIAPGRYDPGRAGA